MGITMIVMASVFLLLQQSQDSFRREPEVADMTANARAGLDRISREATIAGFQTPPSLPVMWKDGGGVNPDVLTLVYGDPNFPVARTVPCPSGPMTGLAPAAPTSRADAGDGRTNGMGRLLQWIGPAGDAEALLPSSLTDDRMALQKRRRGYSRRRRGRSGSGSSESGPAGASSPAGAIGVPCGDVGSNTSFALDPMSVSPQPLDFEEAYPSGTRLMAIQGPKLDDTACDHVAPAIVPVTVSAHPTCSGSGGQSGSPAQCGRLIVRYTAGPTLPGWTPPYGFDADVNMTCAVVGVFHVVQYRVNPPPTSENPSLERRDLLLSPEWEPLAKNIENLQVQYMQGNGGFEDEPTRLPMGNDPNTFVTRLRVSVSSRSESTRLKGASAGVFAAGDTYLRKTFATTVSLRNQLNQAQDKAFDLGIVNWN